MIKVVRSSQRYTTAQPGIVSRHCFAAGPHYDPGNLGFGALIGVDEHTLDPGAGFDWHTHRGVRIASWVLHGSLRHRDATGTDVLIEPGDLFDHGSADLLRHAETNAADGRLRFVQTTWLASTPATLAVVRDHVAVAAAAVHLFVARGSFDVWDHRPAGWPGTATAATASAAAVVAHLDEGDSLRGDTSLWVTGDGELLVWSVRGCGSSPSRRFSPGLGLRLSLGLRHSRSLEPSLCLELSLSPDSSIPAGRP